MRTLGGCVSDVIGRGGGGMMRRFFTFLKTELILSLRDMNMPIFAVIMPLVIFIILGIIYGSGPAYDGADHTFLEQSFGAVCAVSMCAGGTYGTSSGSRRFERAQGSQAL